MPRRDPIILLEQLAEMVHVVIPYPDSNLLEGGIRVLCEELFCLFHPDPDQIVDGRIPGLTLENLGDIEGAQIHIGGDLLQGDLFPVMFLKVLFDLPDGVFLVGRAESETSQRLLRFLLLHILPGDETEKLD